MISMLKCLIELAVFYQTFIALNDFNLRKSSAFLYTIYTVNNIQKCYIISEISCQSKLTMT